MTIELTDKDAAIVRYLILRQSALLKAQKDNYPRGCIAADQRETKIKELRKLADKIPDTAYHPY